MKRICDHAVDVLRSSDNPAVMFGDSGLCHMIADAAGCLHEGPRTERRVLDALRKTPGSLVVIQTRNPVPHGRRWVLKFVLPEHAT